eukprot:GHVT01096412.1.p1 GENE.GHVT01096412.1~~GHVT01096412.1.p1  ORF type:complete len:137 (-),score=8.41 GHVT01096412.1:189-599(-)
MDSSGFHEQRAEHYCAPSYKRWGLKPIVRLFIAGGGIETNHFPTTGSLWQQGMGRKSCCDFSKPLSAPELPRNVNARSRRGQSGFATGLAIVRLEGRKRTSNGDATSAAAPSPSRLSRVPTAYLPQSCCGVSRLYH